MENAKKTDQFAFNSKLNYMQAVSECSNASSIHFKVLEMIFKVLETNFKVLKAILKMLKSISNVLKSIFKVLKLEITKIQSVPFVSQVILLFETEQIYSALP